MPTNSKKVLYLGNCVEDLHKLGEVDIPRDSDPEKHLKVAEKAFSKAEELWIEGDEEKSFVLFMRYINSVEKCKKTYNYSKSPSKFNQLISIEKFMTSIDRCEGLKVQLQKRYKEKKSSQENLSKPALTPKPAEVQEEVKGPFVTPSDAYSLLSAKPPLAVVIDCRSVKDRNQGIIIKLPVIFLPTDKPLLSTSLSYIKLELSRINMKLNSVLLVLMDADSQELTAGVDKPVLELRDTLYKFDTNNELKEAPRILDGGYESWKLHYPMFSDGSSSKLVDISTPNDEVIFPTIDSPTRKQCENIFTPEVSTNGDNSIDELANEIRDSLLPTQNVVESDLVPVNDTSPPTIPPKPSHLSANKIPPSTVQNILAPEPISSIVPEPNSSIVPDVTNHIPPSLDIPNPRVSIGPIPSPPSYETAVSLPRASVPPVPLPPPISRPPDPILAPIPVIPEPTVRIPPENQLTQESAITPQQLEANKVSEQMEIELQEKEMRLRALESELARKDLLEEKVRVLEQQSGAEARDIELQKRRMLEEIANEKQRADQELIAKQHQLIALEQQTKQQLRQEMESINIEKGNILQEKTKLDMEKRQVAEGKMQLEREKFEFERVKRLVLEQQKQAQQSQASNPSHHFTPEQTTVPQMQLNHGLPVGWRKLFDSPTGRFYYQDDTTKTTHWNPPTSWIVSQQPNIMQGKTKGALLSSFNQNDTIKHTPASGQTPVFDRSTKPTPKTPEIPSRATKNPALSNPYYPQILARIQSKSKSRAFDPSYGGMGQALTGLKNLGNTCFMNSIIQCLSAAYPLAEYFISLRFIQHVNPVNPLGMGGEIAEEFAFLVQALWRGNYKSIAPKDFKRVLSKFAPQFSGTQQHDSQEFLAFLLDGLHEDLNKVLRKEYILEQDNQGVPDVKASQISWENHLKRNDSIIVDLFQGQFRSTLTCLKCGFSSVTFEAFMYLSVPIPGSANVTLIDCVKQFTKVEKVSGSNSWFCARCKTHRESAKQLEIWRLPPVLLIHLKRFSYVGKWKQKLDTNVNFPLSGLNLAPMTLGPLKPTEYQLFAVSNHSGNLEGGHYTAYVRHASNKKFYTFDDSVVRDMSTSSVLTKNGYMLFYTSVDFTPKLKL
ncbi:Ubiquitin carboxyl-terminal hydrolase 8-like [Oopsacas minuta]|uniref:ubiquitinyl hydrolase 1 n=1 Tax=Oopsacas minuta TaxID=111878 RepID=A0AAV7KJP9_9METZ|nr:Ubiquitin carboxyl-terminal hydrolase 8-like [Oopsacas minuta]